MRLDRQVEYLPTGNHFPSITQPTFCHALNKVQLGAGGKEREQAKVAALEGIKPDYLLLRDPAL